MNTLLLITASLNLLTFFFFIMSFIAFDFSFFGGETNHTPSAKKKSTLLADSCFESVYITLKVADMTSQC